MVTERRASGGEAPTRAAAGETLAKRSQTETSGVIGIETEMIAALNVVIEIAVTTENKESHLEIRMMVSTCIGCYGYKRFRVDVGLLCASQPIRKEC